MVTEATTIPDIREMPEGLMEGILETTEALIGDTRKMPMARTEETAQVRIESRTEAIFRRNRTAAAEEAAIWQSGLQGLQPRESFSDVWPEGRWRA